MESFEIESNPIHSERMSSSVRRSTSSRPSEDSRDFKPLIPKHETPKKETPKKEIGDSEDNEPEAEGEFKYSHGLTSQEGKALLEQHGRNELPEKKIPKWYIFVSQLWQPMPIMIWLAAVVELGIQNYLDMGILLMIQFANASIGYYEITKAGDAVAALKKSLKPTATVKRDGKFAVIDAALVVPGDLVLLGSGSAIPADCRVNEGEIDVDEAALTGESLPVTKYQGSGCKMGSTVVRGEVEGTVEFTGANTFFGKTAALLGVSFSFSNKSNMWLLIIYFSHCFYLIIGYC